MGEYWSTPKLINMSNLPLIYAILAGCFCASQAQTTAPLNPVTTAPLNPVTTAPLNPVTTAPLNPVTTAPLNPVTTAPLNPVTTMPLNPPVTVAVTTMPLNPPVTVAVTTMPLNPPVTVKPVTTMPLIPPVTAAPVKGCKKKKSVLTIKTYKKIKKVTTPKKCEMLCKRNSKRCKVWGWMKKAKVCMLQAFAFKKDKKVDMTGMINCMVPNAKGEADDMRAEEDEFYEAYKAGYP